MKKEDLQKAILELLPKSGISGHRKEMIEILLPVMAEQELQGIFDALNEESIKLKSLAEKKKRIELKYKVMTERFAQTENKP